MIVHLVIAFGLTSATVLIHALGTMAAIAHVARVWRHAKNRQSLWFSSVQMVRVVCILLLLHLIEAGVWAGFYQVSGLLPDLEASLYFSLTSYTTVGYGDVVLPRPWRLLGPIQAAVGILMFGWSTGVMVATITR